MDNLEQALLESENSLMLLSDEELITPINDILIINPETRLIEVPSTELLLGVFGENLVEKKYFKCPRIILNNIDLYECFIFINYVSASGRIGSIQSENVELDETEQYILFDWDLTNNVFDKNKDSAIYFSVSAKQYLEDSEPVFATRKAQGKMYETVNGTEHVTQEHADIILQILAGMKTKVDLPKDEDGNLLVPEEGQTLLFKEDGTTYYGTPSGGGGTSFSGSAKDVTYDDTETKLGAENVQDAIGKLSEEIVDYNIEPKTDDIPKIFFDGAIPQTKDDVVTKFRYISKTMDFEGYAEFKAQGNSSMYYPKKNMTVKMYKDAELTEKLKVDFKGWGEQRKHVYKANWIDLLHARNVVSARIWADVVKSRANYEELPELYRTSPNQGAVDGFPIKVYSQGIYQGRYTLNIPKDAWMANMDDELDNHCILCGENYASGCFRALAKIDESDWTDEVHDTVPDSIKARWNEVISFVMNSTDEDFKTNLGEYFFVDSLIDYFIYGMLSCGLDAFGKNQIYMTYDGVKWIASMYDMDSTWGLYYNGSKFVSATYGRTEYEDYVSKNATCSGEGNLLYNRLQKLFYEEIKSRYEELKHGVLSVPNIINHFERFTDIAALDLVKEDYASTTGNGKFTGIPSKYTNNIQQIRKFVVDRYAYCDEYFTDITPVEPVPATSISLDKTALTFTDFIEQTIVATVEPSNTTDKIVWESSDTSIATVSNGIITPVSNGETVITATCGEYSAECTVSVSGLDESTTRQYTLTQGYTVNDSGEFVTSGDNKYALESYVPVIVGKTYEISGTNVWLSVRAYDENKNYVSTLTVATATDTNAIITIPEGVSYIRWCSTGADALSYFGLYVGNSDGNETQIDYEWTSDSGVAPVDANGVTSIGSMVNGLWKLDEGDFALPTGVNFEIEIVFKVGAIAPSRNSPSFAFVHSTNANGNGNGFKIYAGSNGNIFSSIGGSNTDLGVAFPTGDDLLILKAVSSSNGGSFEFAGLTMTGNGLTNNQYLKQSSIGILSTADVQLKELRYRLI